MALRMKLEKMIFEIKRNLTTGITVNQAGLLGDSMN